MLSGIQGFDKGILRAPQIGKTTEIPAETPTELPKTPPKGGIGSCITQQVVFKPPEEPPLVTGNGQTRIVFLDTLVAMAFTLEQMGFYTKPQSFEFPVETPVEIVKIVKTKKH